jgi:hypothetical protein
VPGPKDLAAGGTVTLADNGSNGSGISL